jgi:hypothetical protein
MANNTLFLKIVRLFPSRGLLMTLLLLVEISFSKMCVE